MAGRCGEIPQMTTETLVLRDPMEIAPSLDEDSEKTLEKLMLEERIEDASCELAVYKEEADNAGIQECFFRQAFKEVAIDKIPVLEKEYKAALRSYNLWREHCDLNSLSGIGSFLAGNATVSLFVGIIPGILGAFFDVGWISYFSTAGLVSSFSIGLGIHVTSKASKRLRKAKQNYKPVEEVGRKLRYGISDNEDSDTESASEKNIGQITRIYAEEGAAIDYNAILERAVELQNGSYKQLVERNNAAAILECQLEVLKDDILPDYFDKGHTLPELSEEYRRQFHDELLKSPVGVETYIVRVNSCIDSIRQRSLD